MRLDDRCRQVLLQKNIIRRRICDNAYIANVVFVAAPCSRYVYNRKDIAGILGQESAQAWGFLVKPDKTGQDYWVNYFMQAGMPRDQAMQSAQQTMQQAAPIDEAFEAAVTAVK